MAHDVHCTLVELLSVFGSMNVAEATKYMEDLEKNSRYQRDVWVT